MASCPLKLPLPSYAEELLFDDACGSARLGRDHDDSREVMRARCVEVKTPSLYGGTVPG